MAKGLLGKLFGGDQEAALDSCCGAVNVVPEDETTSESEAQQQTRVTATEASQ